MEVLGQKGPIAPPPDWKIERVLKALSETIDWSHGFFGLNPDFYDVDCSNISVGVLDTGIDTHHLDLNPVEALDFTGSPNGPDDHVDHGTWCCGYIAAVPNEIGVLGITGNRTRQTTAALHSYKVLGDDGSGFDRWIKRGLKAAIDAKLDIISCSWGGGPPNPEMEELFNAFIDQGGFPFAAAGNSGNRRDEDYPAKYDRVAGIAAIGKNGRLTRFSSYGPNVVCCAPGYQMLSTIPGGYGLMSGTSMSAPCVAGVWAKALAAALQAGHARPTMVQAIKFIRDFAKTIAGYLVIDPETLLAEVAKSPVPPPAVPAMPVPEPPALPEPMPMPGGQWRWAWVPN